MAKGISLHIGINKVDPKHYDGWDGELIACEADADDMEALAKSQGFTSIKKLITKNATRAAVIREITAATKKLVTGDIFFLTYSGHGGQLPDKNADERDHKDETWVLFDGEIVDDELYYLYSQFADGVRVVVLSDSCHSGTVTKARYYDEKKRNNGNIRFRNMPPEIALRTYRKNKTFYDKILSDKKLKECNPSSKSYNGKLKASVRLISGCMDNQLSNDGEFNGLFTACLLDAWNEGNFKGTYAQLRKKIGAMMPPDQTPHHYLIGKQNAAFNKQQPFSI